MQFTKYPEEDLIMSKMRQRTATRRIDFTNDQHATRATQFARTNQQMHKNMYTVTTANSRSDYFAEV